MTLENQVVSLELAQKLKELGVKQESLFHWSRGDNHGGLEVRYRQYVSEKDGEAVEHCSAFTVAELGEMLPKGQMKNGYEAHANLSFCVIDGPWENTEHGQSRSHVYLDAYKRKHSEADARAKMLIYLLENKLIAV
jgi:hypothetical protein